jgi:hypothetical protein
LPTRLIVAGGGGGGGGEGGPSAVTGGLGGLADRSGSAGSVNTTLQGGEGGARATSSGGGAGGAISWECPHLPSCARAGTEAAGGHGGAGAPAGGGGGGGGGGIFGGGGGGGGEGFELSQSVFEDGGGGGGGGGASGVPAAGVGRVSGFLQLLTALGAEPSISLSWTVPPAGVALSPPTVATGPPGTLTTPTPGPGSGSGALTVTGLTVSPNRFRRGGREATITRSKAKKVPTSTTISFGLSQPAAVRLSFQVGQPGVLARGKCIAPTKGRRRGGRCTRYVAVSGAVSRAGHAGTNRIRFQGILDGGRALAPGSYQLTLIASGGAVATTAAQHPVFTIVR